MNLDICAVSPTQLSFLHFLSFSSSVLVDNKHSNISVNFRVAFLPLGSLGFFTQKKNFKSPPVIFLVFTLHYYLTNYLENMYS